MEYIHSAENFSSASPAYLGKLPHAFAETLFFTLSNQQGNTRRSTQLGKLGDAQNRCHDHVDSGSDEHCRSNPGHRGTSVRKPGLRLDLVPRSPHHCQMRTPYRNGQ